MDAFLVYDGGCGLCTLAKRLVKALDLRGRIQPVPLQAPESARLLAAMDAEQRWSSFHFVAGEKTASRGEGIVEILGALPMGQGIPRLAAEMPVLVRASERLYSLFHGLRDSLECPT